MNLFLAHITGVPHHFEETQSIMTLWPIAVAIIEVSWLLFRRRVANLITSIRNLL